MKAIVVTEAGAEPTVADVHIDSPRGREVLVEVKACGLCRSDITFAQFGIGTKFPAIFGHEVAGVVTQVGPEVRTLHPGDHVIGTLIRSCRECSNCRSGKVDQCTRREVLARAPESPPRVTLSDGTPVATAMGTAGFAEFALIHENQLVAIPSCIPFHYAAVAGCSTLTGAGTIMNSPAIRRSSSIAVFGAGGVGLNAVNAAAIVGIPTIIAVDTRQDARDLALSMGATHTVAADQGDVTAAIREISTGGVEVAVEFVGAPDVVMSALRSTSVGGSVFLGGIPKPTAELTIQLMPDLIHPRRTIVPVYMGSSDPQRDIPIHMDRFSDGALHLERLVTQTIALEEVPRYLTDTSVSSPGRVVMVNA